jgi:hypothetical protein
MAAEWPDIILAGAAVMTLVAAAHGWQYARTEGVRKVVDDNADKAKKENDSIHNRISDVRDMVSDTREKWVQKADFERTESRLEARLNTGLTELTDQIRKVGDTLSGRMDALLIRLNGNGNHHPGE